MPVSASPASGASVATVARIGRYAAPATHSRSIFSIGVLFLRLALTVKGEWAGYRTQMENTLVAAGTLRRGVLTLSRRLQGERSPHGLSLTKISMLSHLARQGEMTPGELAAADRLRPQSVTRVLAELEQAGLAVRVRDAGDGRQRRLRLTPAGVELLAADMSQRDEWLSRAMTELLTPTERDLVTLAAALLERLGGHSAASTAGPADPEPATPMSR
jgi:DNA-binding MarR family transcriptional regulator